MYLNTTKHYLSKAICLSALIRMLAQVLNVVSRILFSSNLSEPDMLNSTIFYFNMTVDIIVIFVIAGIFTKNLKEMKNIMSIVMDDDIEKMGLLQKQYIPNGISSLKAEAIFQLLEIWASIMLFIQVMSIVSGYQYKRFIAILYEIIPMDSYNQAVLFSGIYNSTHGFKYIGMFAAFIIGIFTTAVFLKDRFLKVVTVGITAAFLLAFTIFQMITVATEIKIISIVWTSVIYHGLETIGLLLFSLYLAKHYKGL